MYISGIRYRIQGTKLAKGWRFSPGVGKMRPVISVVAGRDQHIHLAQSINFALTGKRYEKLEEVWLDAVDDAGNIWTIERGPKGSIFKSNHKVLSIDEAQRSLLASLLDLDVSLSQSEGLIAPIEFRQIISHGSEIAASAWDLGGIDDHREVPSQTAAELAAKRCAEKLGVHHKLDAERLAKIAGAIGRLYGAFHELLSQASALESTFQDASPQDQDLESAQGELDVLNQIDQLLRRVNEGGDSYARLTQLMESHISKINDKESKWTADTLLALLQMPDPTKVLDQAVHCRAWGRFYELLTKICEIAETQIRPVAAENVKVWSDFVTGSRANGQDIESSLASMLLGIKQLSQEVDRYVSQQQNTRPSQPGPKVASWFDRLRTSSPQVVDAKYRDAAPMLRDQRDWVQKLAREVESIRVAIEYSLQCSLGLVEKLNEIQGRGHSELAVVAQMKQKVGTELERQRREWQTTASQLGINEQIGVDQLSVLLKDAFEYLVLLDTKHDLAIRIEDRKAVQTALETQVKQWWGLIGSQKSVDLSNVSFLIVEAKGALRYREGRRQRILKGLEQSAMTQSRHMLQKWNKARRLELENQWIQVSREANISSVEMTDGHLSALFEGSMKCAALLEIAKVEEANRFSASSFWPSKLDSSVVLYSWHENSAPPSKVANFVKCLDAFAGAGGMPVIMMICDANLGGQLQKLGIGQAHLLEDSELDEIQGPKRGGAVVKSELRQKAPQASPVKKSESSPSARTEGKNSLLSPRARAALNVLNPKGLK